jgi:hypothetical protein
VDEVDGLPPAVPGHPRRREIDDVRRQLDLLASTRLVAALDDQRQRHYEALCCRERELLLGPPPDLEAVAASPA